MSTTFWQSSAGRTRRHAEFASEDYADIEEAARAVAEKALKLTHDGPPKRGFKPGR